MSKPKLIYRTQDYPNFSQGWIRPLVEAHWEMVEWEPGCTYNSSDAVLTTYQQEFDPSAWFRSLEQQGHKIIVDHLFDSDVDTPTIELGPNKIELRSGNWMWYRTALLAAHYNYNQYQPNWAWQHDFLCLMNKPREHRDRVATELAPELATARWSYVDRGHEIGDAQERATEVFWEYYMNPQWYNSTAWHFVVESWVRSDAWFASPTFPNYRTEISEKSYKPLAYFQPFIILGSEGTLRFLKKQGFETFDNLWDESYDNIESDAERTQTVLNLVRDTAKVYNRHSAHWDAETQRRLAHNNQRFFDLDLVRQRFESEIIGDIRKFLSQ